MPVVIFMDVKKCLSRFDPAHVKLRWDIHLAAPSAGETKSCSDKINRDSNMQRDELNVGKHIGVRGKLMRVQVKQ